MDESRRRRSGRPGARAGIRKLPSYTEAAAIGRARQVQRRARLEANGLRIGEQLVPLHAGSLHYFRLDPASWRPALEALVEMGVGIVESYVPWNVHEITPDQYDFGSRDPRKDLPGFLDLVQEHGLYAFLRPGPHVNGELDCLGLPEHIVRDEACQARTAHGGPVHCLAPPRMFAAPSYASRKYLAAVDRWYLALAEILAPRAWPHGPLVMLQVDDEAALFYRDAPYDQDYHPDALADFRAFVRGRHGSLGRLRAAYGQAIQRWAAVTPPSAFTARNAGDLNPHLDWMAFQENMICTALSVWSARLRSSGLDGISLVHNLPLGDSLAPASPHAISQVVDGVGIDLHPLRRDLSAVRRRTLRAAGSMSQVFATELAVGMPPWLPPHPPEDAVQVALCALAHGMRGLNLYMAVDRDRWCGAPIAEDGTPRPHAQVWQRLFRTLQRLQFHELQRRSEVAILLPREYARLSRASFALGGMGPSLFEASMGPPSHACLQEALGFGQPIQQAWWRVVEDVARALDLIQVPYVYCDSDCDLRQLIDTRLIIAPSFEFASTSYWQSLQGCAARGTLVVVGPRQPELDQRMHPDTFPLVDGMRLLDLSDADGIERLLRGLVSELGLSRPFPAQPASVWTTVHEADAQPRVLFVGHTESRPVRARIALSQPWRAVDALTQEVYEGERHLQVDLAPASCRMLLLHPKSAAGAPTAATEGSRC